MARILVTTMPIPGHINPMMPIVGTLLERDHDVAWYTGRLFRRSVEKTGARYLPIQAGLDLDLTDDAVLPERHRLSGVAQLKYYLKHLFLDSAPGQVEDLEAALAQWDADVILSDLTFVGGLYVAERGGPPCAMLAATAYPLESRDTAPYGLALPPSATPWGRVRNTILNAWVNRVVFADVNRYARRIRARLGLPPTRFPFMESARHLPALLLQATGESFEYPRSDYPPTLRFIGPLLHRPPEGFHPPPWWDELDSGRPVVHVTQGTIATDHSQLMVPTIQALAEEDVLVVATTAGRPVEEFPLRPLPDNVRMEQFVPYHFLLPRVDVIVTNAGYGGVQFALAHGVPLVAAGRTEDKAEVSARIEWAGVGITFQTESPSPERLRKAIRTILADGRFQARARQIQADFAAHDAATEAACHLEELVGERGRVAVA